MNTVCPSVVPSGLVNTKTTLSPLSISPKILPEIFTLLISVLTMLIFSLSIFIFPYSLVGPNGVGVDSG